MTKEKEKDKATPEEIARRRKKTISLGNLSEKIRGLRKKVTMDMKSDDEKLSLIATAVAMMDCTAERVGNDTSAKHGHVGVTGFQKKHVTVFGNKITLNYVGKSGVQHEKECIDDRIAKILAKCLKRCKKDDDFVLVTSDGQKIQAAAVNRYLSQYDVTAKDIRGYAANHMVISSLQNREKSSDEAERKKVMSEVLQKVAEAVGHGKATLRKHYLLPHIEDEYVKKGKVPTIKRASIVASVVHNICVANRNEAVTQNVLSGIANPMMARLYRDIGTIYKDKVGLRPESPDDIQLVVNGGDLPDGKVASYKYDDGVLTLSRKSFDETPIRLYWILAHELIHAVIGKESDSHGETFNMLADAIEMPKGVRD